MKFDYKKLIKYRKRERLSCSQLCELIGIGRTTYWKWESGSALPDENYIRLIAKNLNISVSDISDLEPELPVSEINYSETINSYLSFMGMDFEIFQQKSINEALQKILSLNQELLKASVIIRALLKATTSIIYVKDKDLKYITANDAFLKNVSLNSGYKVFSKTDDDFFTQTEAKFNFEEDKNVLITGNPVSGVERYIPGSRKKKWGYVSKQPIFDNNNKISGVIGSFTDITKLKELEGKRMILENAVNSLDSYIWIAKYNPASDKNVQVLYLSKSVLDICRQKFSESIEDKNYNEICESFRPLHYSYINDLIKSGNGIFPFNREYYEFSKIYNNHRFFLERIVNYESHYYFGILEDITERKATEKNLKLLDISIDGMSDAVGIFDIKQNKYIYLNNAIEKITGYSIDNFYNLGREFWLNTCVHPEDRELQSSYLKIQEWPLNRELRIIKPDGKVSWVEARTFPKNKSFGNETVITILRDITEQKKLQEERELLNIHINEMPFGIIIMDIKNFENIFVSKTVEEIFGYDYANFTGRSGFTFWLNNCVHPEDRENQKQLFINKSWPANRQYKILKPNGEVRLIEVKNSKITKYLERECYVAIISDITELNKNEEHLNLLKHAFENSIDCLTIRQAEPKKLIFISKSCFDIFGYSREEFLKDVRIRVNKCVHPDDRISETEYLKSKERPPIRTYRIITHEGREKLIQESTFVMKYNDIEYHCGISRDITINKDTSILVNKRNREIAKKLKEKGVNLDLISYSTELSAEEINNL